MFEDYKMAILNFYRDKRSKGLLSTEMESPNRERLRKECIAVFLKKDSKADNDFVQKFFDPKRSYESQLRSIEKYKLDGFRPLVAFLTQKENERRDIRDDNQIKLLAWLLDFPNYEDWRKSTLGLEPTLEDTDGEFYTEKNASEGTPKEQEEGGSDCESKEFIKGGKGEKIDNDISNDVKEIEIPSTTEDDVEDPIVQENTPTSLLDEPQKSIKKLNFIQRTGIVATLGLIMGVAYWKGVPPDGCMYWTGTEYKAVDCDAQIPNTQILALNQQKLEHFKKITLPDTLTFNSLNKVWYSKINNEVEFFTTKGKHPLKTDRVLKPITTHILGKYGNNRILSLSHQTDTTEKD